MTKIAAMFVYVKKTFKTLHLRNQCTCCHETGYVSLCNIRPVVCSNDLLGLTMTYLTARSHLVVCVFEQKRLLHDHSMGKLAASDQSDGTYMYMNKLMGGGGFCLFPRDFIHLHVFYHQFITSPQNPLGQSQPGGGGGGVLPLPETLYIYMFFIIIL